MVYYKQMDHCLDFTARAVFIINPSGKITYKGIVPEITTEPNYNAILAAVTETTSTACCGSLSLKTF